MGGSFHEGSSFFEEAGTPSSASSVDDEEAGAEKDTEQDHEVWEARVKSRFAQLLGLPLYDVDGREFVSRTVRMLLLCGYKPADLAPVFAHALVVFDRVLPALPMGGAHMAPIERTAIAVVTCYLAHAYMLDETCPLKYWQNRIYVDYCSLKDLNLAVMKVMKLAEYKLAAPADLVETKRALLAA
jgi:hypothetical protein